MRTHIEGECLSGSNHVSGDRSAPGNPITEDCATENQALKNPSTPDRNGVSGNKATCTICPAACRLKEGHVGKCGARQAVRGHVVDQNYGRITSFALDPIEKKPLAKYMPGSKVLSVGSYGCNLACPFCQNSAIACAREDSVPWRCASPEELTDMAFKLRDEGNVGIAYTYNEPLVGFEFVRDTARLIHDAGMRNILVSNGFVNDKPLQELLPFIDAANIDLKSFDPAFYRSIGGDLEVVRHTIEEMAQTPGLHLEITTLVVPGISDDPVLMDEMSGWIASLDPDIPYHLTRFFPCHKMADDVPTDIASIRELETIACRHLHNVFVGNI